MKAFNVYLNSKLIDTVFYGDSAKVDADEVKRSLVGHDGYDPAIEVTKQRRTRKTRDYYAIEQYTGAQYGWEEVNAENTREDAKRSVREYRENQPEYAVRMRKRRERIESADVRVVAEVL